MRRAIRTAVRLFGEVFEPPGPVVEIGSLYTPGYERLSDLRGLFPGRDFIGCDIRRGLGVDRIEDAQALSFADGSVGTVLLLEILEHLPDPHKAVSEAWRVLCDDGILALSVPFTYRLHGFPADFWRFTPSGVHTLLTGFPQKIVFALGPRLKPAFVFAVAVKSDSHAARAAFEPRGNHFRSLVRQTFQGSRRRGYLSTLKERGRDFFGCLLGRAELDVHFFEPGMIGVRSCIAENAHGRRERE